MFEYKIAEKRDIEKCTDVTAESFFDYEYFINYFPSEKKRRNFLHHLIGTVFKSNIKKDKAYIIKAMNGEDIAAVALLCEPGYKKPTDANYLMNGFIKCFFDGSIKTVNAWIKMDTDAGKACHELENHWYISLLTVDNKYKGQGVGTAFINDFIIPFVKEKGSSKLCLFTNSEQNKKFYEKNGFVEFYSETFEYNGKVLGSWSYKKDI